ncbi:heterokaryon incompatibility protein-domain-containing protein [Aspergillus aurantiobrunneus]
MKQGKDTKGAKPSPQHNVAGWYIQPGVGPEPDCTQFRLTITTTTTTTTTTVEGQGQEPVKIQLHSPHPLQVPRHTSQAAQLATIHTASFNYQDGALGIVLCADEGIEWRTEMEVAGDRVIVPAQQEQLAELFVALVDFSGFPAPLLCLSPDYTRPKRCAAALCAEGGLVRVYTRGDVADGEDMLPRTLSYTANEHAWVGDNAPQSSAAVTDLLVGLSGSEVVCIADTCVALTQHKSIRILLSDNIFWWEDKVTEEVPKRKHPKPANWGGFQDLWRNHKNLRESKKRANSSVPVNLDAEAPSVHDSVVQFAKRAQAGSSTTNPLRLVRVCDGSVLATAELARKVVYAVISYTWSQFSKEELLEWATSQAMKLGYEYIWIDQYCIDQTNKAEKNAEIKRMRDYYKSAAQVLVLLPDVTSTASFNVVSSDQLLHVDKALNAATEVLKQFVSCGWLKRVWTFQEAWVARQCVFCTRGQLLDGTIMDALLGLRKYEAVSRPRIMCVSSKAIASAVVANPNLVVWDRLLRQRQTVVGSTERWMLHNSLESYEPPRLTLVQAWEASSGRDTANEEDRVYALLSSVQGGDKVKVDRGRSLQAVIQDCVQAGIVTADLLAGSSPSLEADRCWMPDLAGLGPQHPLRVAGASQIQQALVWQGGRVSVQGKYFHFADAASWFRIAEMKTENEIQQSEVSDRPWYQYAATTRQNTWTTTDIVGRDFLLLQPMPGSRQTVLMSGKRAPDGSFHRRKGHIVWLKGTGLEWLKDSQLVEIGSYQYPVSYSTSRR